MATKQNIFGGSGTISTTATRYAGLMGNGWSASTTSQNGVISTLGKLTNFQVKLNQAPGAGKAWTFTVKLNGNNTLSGAIIGTGTDTGVDTRQIIVSGGDIIGIECIPNGTPADPYAAYWSCDFIPDTAGETILLSNSSGTNLSTNTYLAPMYPKSPDIETDTGFLIPTSGTIKNFYMSQTAAPGVGNSWTYTVRKNGSTTGQMTLILSGAATTDNNTGESISVSANDTIAILSVSGGAPATTANNYGLTFVPSTAGQYIVMSNTDDNLDPNNTEYQFFGCADSTLSTDEAIHQTLSTSATTIKNMYVRLSADPGTSPDQYTFTLMKNSGATALALTIVADDFSGAVTQDVSVSAGDLLDVRIVPANTPSRTPHSQIGFLCYNAPTGGAGTNMQVNIGDSWKSVAAVKVNVGDAWKDVAAAKVNIGDAWKTIF